MTAPNAANGPAPPPQVRYATLRGIVDSATAPIFSVDREYRYTAFNRAHAQVMAALYGASIELGESLLEHMTVAEDRAAARANLDRALAGESFADEAFSGEDRRSRQYFSVAHSPIRGEAGEVIGAAVIVTELTDRRRAEEEQRESERRHRRNDEINAARVHLLQFAATHSLDALLEEAINQAERLSGSCIGFYHFIEEDQRTITLQNWSTRTKAEFCKAQGRGSHYPIAEGGVWVDAAHARAPVVHNDYASLPHRKGMPEGHATVVRELVVPVMRGDRMIAMLGVGNKASDYGPEDVEVVSLLADLASEITERKRAEESLRRTNRQLRAISDCNQALMRATDELVMVQDVCRIICQGAGYRMAWVGNLEHDEARTIRLVAMAGEGTGYVDEARLTWADGERGRGPAGRAARSGHTVAVQDLEDCAEFAPWIGLARRFGYRSAIWLPLKDDAGSVFGLLLIYSAEVGSFSAEEIELLEELAGDLGFGVTALRGRARRKDAERTVALMSFALDNVREAAYLVDEQGRIRFVNDAGCRGLGYGRAELLAMKVEDIDPAFTPALWPAHWRELREKRALVVETEHRARDGRFFPVEVSANYFEYEGEGYNLALAHDVTERRKLEEQLRQAQKMEAIGTLAGGVAHDFNNVLTGIVGYGNVLLEELPPEDPRRDSVEQILAASDRAAQLTRGLLAFSRKQVINPKPVDLNEIVANLERLLRRLIGEDVDLSTALAPSPLVVMADAGQIEQVLMNLATNARDAMPDGGALSIATEAVELDEAWVEAHGWGKPGLHARLSVSDEGVGMDEATRQRAFEPFFTSKAPGKGTGLGLAIVYGIVKQHGGTVDLYSEPGRGTTFKILFPIVAAAVEPVKPRAATQPVRGTETILVAEDDRIVRGMLSSVLTGHGYQVIEAVDGVDALEQWAGRRAEIALLILDVVMPRKSGRDVYDAVRAERPGVRALFLSGYTADIIHRKGVFEEGIEFMSKPLSPIDLARKVREILDAPAAPDGGAGPRSGGA